MHACVGILSFLPSGVNASSPSVNIPACITWQSSPFLGVKEIGGHLLFGTRLDFKWHPREKFQPLILATPDLHWIKGFFYFHNFYIYVSFSILYSWMIHGKQIERATHNICDSTLYQSGNTYLGENEPNWLVKGWLLTAGMLLGSIEWWWHHSWMAELYPRTHWLQILKCQLTHWVHCFEYNPRLS